MINHGPAEIITDYLIGPLPISNLTNIRPLSEIYHNPIPLNGRNVFNWTAIRVNMYHFMEPIDDITRDLFNGSVLDDTLSAAGHAPMSYDGSWTRSWIQLRRNTPGSWLTGIDFFMRVSLPSLHPHGVRLILAGRYDGNGSRGIQDPSLRA